MKFLPHSPAKSLSKAYLRQSLRRDQIDLFKSGLARMFERIRTDEHEEVYTLYGLTEDEIAVVEGKK